MSFGQFFNSIYHVVDNNSFMNEFRQFSKDGNRHGMIEMIMQVEQALELEIMPSYTGKNHDTAQKIYNNIKLIQEKAGEKIVLSKIEQLTKALYAADVNSSLFVDIITTRARFWFSIGYYTKCIKECNFAIETLNNNNTKLLNNTMENVEKYITVCNVLKNQCTKLINKSGIKERQRIYYSPAKIPKVDGMVNKKLKSCSDALSLGYSTAKGRQLIATRNIKAGTVLIVDEPFAFSTDNQALLTNCLHCHVSLDLDSNIYIPCINCQTVRIINIMPLIYRIFFIC